MEHYPPENTSSRNPPKDFPNLAQSCPSRVQLLRQRFEQQAAAAQQSAAATAPKAGWTDDFKRVDVRSLRQRLFAEPDSRGRQPAYQPISNAVEKHHDVEQPQLQQPHQPQPQYQHQHPHEHQQPHQPQPQYQHQHQHQVWQPQPPERSLSVEREIHIEGRKAWEEPEPYQQQEAWEERPPEPPPREDDGPRVSDAELSSLAQTLKALGLGSFEEEEDSPSTHRHTTPGRAH